MCSFEWEIGRTGEWGEGEWWVVSSPDARMWRKGQQGESRRTLGSPGESGHVPGGTSDGTDDWQGASKRVTRGSQLEVCLSEGTFVRERRRRRTDTVDAANQSPSRGKERQIFDLPYSPRTCGGSFVPSQQDVCPHGEQVARPALILLSPPTLSTSVSSKPTHGRTSTANLAKGKKDATSQLDVHSTRV